MDEERRNGSNCDDKTIPLEEEQTVPLRENRVFLNQVRKPKLKHAWSSNERSSYNQSQGNRPPYGQSQDYGSHGTDHFGPQHRGGHNGILTVKPQQNCQIITKHNQPAVQQH